MQRSVYLGETLPVSVKVEFEGTVRNHVILIESQFIPTINGRKKNHKVKLDGSPIHIYGKFIGVSGSKIKKFEVTINDTTAFKLDETKLKHEVLEISSHVHYDKFHLIQI